MTLHSNSFARTTTHRAEGPTSPHQVEGLTPVSPALSVGGGTGPGCGVTPHHLITEPTSGASFSLDKARRTVRQVSRSNDEIMAACAVLKAHGDYCDHMMADHLVRVIEADRQILEVV